MKKKWHAPNDRQRNTEFNLEKGQEKPSSLRLSTVQRRKLSGMAFESKAAGWWWWLVSKSRQGITRRLQQAWTRPQACLRFSSRPPGNSRRDILMESIILRWIKLARYINAWELRSLGWLCLVIFRLLFARFLACAKIHINKYENKKNSRRIRAQI